MRPTPQAFLPPQPNVPAPPAATQDFAPAPLHAPYIATNTPRPPTASADPPPLGQAEDDSDMDLSAVNTAMYDDGDAVCVDQPASFMHNEGICALVVLSPWEKMRSLKVTQHISLNELHNILRRAPNLEHAHFTRIVADSGRSRQRWTTIEAPMLETLTITRAETCIGDVLNDLRVEKLSRLHVGYSPHSAQNVWWDEQSYYHFLRQVRTISRGRVLIVSGDEWYGASRAAHMRDFLLEKALRRLDSGSYPPGTAGRVLY
ncbi:hypothetical protein BD626DRAFT_406190 [Schizophyllum amplum]|uniref:Uncharacterized protein n=1 Tax=Schizophyllum amplum TaxID=97359 RepID=A0A550C8B9_9AGAR|nr:hypothetical protein BD626DRAFT_406190 [Auriculariopsis ampla]